MMKNKGFTLLEVLLVVAIIAALVGIVIFAINPGQQLADTRDAERGADANTILNAVYQYSIDNNGAIPEGIEETTGEICKEGMDPDDDDCDVSLDVLTDEERYLVMLPEDPANPADSDGIGYKIAKTEHGRIVVTAPNAENVTISVTR